MTTIKKIKEIVEQEGITRYQIARKSGISDILLKRYFAGEVTPSIRNIEKIIASIGYELKITKKQNSE